MNGIVQTYQKEEKDQNDSKKKQLDNDFPADQIILDEQDQILSIKKIKPNLSQLKVQKTVQNLNQKQPSRLVKPTKIQFGEIQNIAFQSFHNYRPNEISMDNFYTQRFLKITDGDRHRPIEPKKQNICFSSQDFQFGEYMWLEIDYHKRIQKHLADFSQQLFALQTQITSNDKFFNRQRILKRAQNVYQTNEFIFHRQSLKTKQLEKQLFRQYGQVQKNLSPFRDEIQKITELQKQQQDLNSKYQSVLQKLILAQREQSQAQKSINEHLFQISIIKFQQSTTLYRYGAKVSLQTFNKEDVFNPNLVKWDAPVKGLQIMDLRIFVLNALYPLVGEIFNEFLSHSNVYKVMFNQCSKLSNIDIQSSFVLLKAKIEKFLLQKKFSNLGEFFKNNGKNRRRKIIVISSQTKFKQILNEVTKDLYGLKNQLINLLNINFQFNNKRYEDSCFYHHNMIIEFEYQKINFSTTIDLLHSPCEKITKLQIQNIRRKTYKTEPVLVWFEIPKFASKEKTNDYKLTHLLLKKCHFFSTQMERQYEAKRYI